MKNLLKSIILMMTLSFLFSCNKSSDTASDGKPDGRFKMKAVINLIGDRIEVTVIESEYTAGVHWVITADATEYFGKNGSKISRSDLKSGDTVEIRYSGQVMMSYPPQIVAASIAVVS